MEPTQILDQTSEEARSAAEARIKRRQARCSDCLGGGQISVLRSDLPKVMVADQEVIQRQRVECGCRRQGHGDPVAARRLAGPKRKRKRKTASRSR